MPSSTDTDNAEAAAAQALAAEDPSAAIECLRSVLGQPRAPSAAALPDETWRRLWTLLQRAFGGLSLGRLSVAAMATAEQPADPEACYDLAFLLYEQRLHDLAATALQRADARRPQDPLTLTEWVANLEELGLHREACAVLRAAQTVLAEVPFARFLLAFNGIMCGELEEARGLLPGLASGWEAEEAERGAVAAGQIAGMLDRAEVLNGVSPLDADDLIGWHAVIDGTLLLHEAPERQSLFKGRYDLLVDSPALVRTGLATLATTLAVANKSFSRVVALPGASSELLARAAAAVFGLPWVSLDPTDPDPGGLFVAYDLADVPFEARDDLDLLLEYSPERCLFVHRTCWTKPFPYAPDLTTLLYAIAGSGAPVDPATGLQRAATFGEGDDVEREAKLAQVLAATPFASPARVTTIARALSDLSGSSAAGLFRMGGPRRQQRKGSPVRSARRREAVIGMIISGGAPTLVHAPTNEWIHG